VDIIQERSKDFKLQLSDQRELIADMLDKEKNKIDDTLKSQIDVLTQNTSSLGQVLMDNMQIVDQHAESHVANIVQSTEKLQEVIVQSC
ncbi:hypothetical protein OH705_27545, partial [Pseudomonas sp. BJa3]|nr:hypothetical protein [Pseudomonas sp. BJa3]